MRLALLSDIHANQEAFEACLVHARALAVDRYALLGDFVGYGPDPGPVLERVMALVSAGAAAVIGNHDAAVLAGPGPHMNGEARRVVQWTRERLDDAQLAFLAALPERIERDGRLLVHANAWAPREWAYVAGTLEAARSLRATTCRLTFCGHIHEPALFHMGADGRVASFTPIAGVAVPLARTRRWLAIAGSVGQPRDGNPAAAYAVYDDAGDLLVWYRVPYDYETSARKIAQAGLPPNLGERLRRGQ